MLGVISLASWGAGGPPFIEKNFCNARLKRPARISLKRAIDHAGLAMMIPSTVGVPASTSSITSLSRSPEAAIQESAGVLSSEGVTPAVPPPCTGVRSLMVSDPLYMVMRLPTVVLRTRRMTCAGQGRYSYCQPASGFRPSWFAVIAVEKMNCGISDRPRARARALARLVQRHHHPDAGHRDLHSKESCKPTP